jgi:PKD repeat protein
MSFQLDATPPPVAGFGFSPSDPSLFETVQFFDFSSDPGGVGFQPPVWQFGDGESFTGFNAFHRYAADGDYTAVLNVTTVDGRTASQTQTVHVKTHDVAITKLSAPQSARSGQTKQITASLRNTRYPENIQVQLFKSSPSFGGFQQVGTTTILVPVRQGNQTIPVVFSYTFTSEDAVVGKVTFRAEATLVNGRDALPADNTAVAPPTKVTR